MVLSLLSSMHVEYDATWPSRLGDEREREQIRAMLDGSIKEPFKEKQHQYVYRVETSVAPPISSAPPTRACAVSCVICCGCGARTRPPGGNICRPARCRHA